VIEYAYPHDLARYVRACWSERAAEGALAGASVVPAPLPPPAVLDAFLSVAYQASLLRDEGRGVIFRLLLAGAEHFPEDEGPPTGLHRLDLTEPRPLTAHELRVLAPAVDYYRSLIAVRPGRDDALEIWGILHSGPRWLRSLQGGRRAAPPLPPVLAVHATGPGRIEVSCGSTPIGKLDNGRVLGRSMDVFRSRWLPAWFASVRREVEERHATARRQADRPWAALAPDVLRTTAQHMVRRILSAIVSSHHGGALLVVPPERAAELLGANPDVRFRYTFRAGEPRRRFQRLITEVLNTLAALGARTHELGHPMTWKDYESSTDSRLAGLEEAIFELSHLIARLAAIDGAVVLTKRFELLGFGAEIIGGGEYVPMVARAVDLEGEHREVEPTTNVGMRHHSAYRLCQDVRDALAIVVSQDGSVQFVRWLDGSVTYWNQEALSGLTFDE